LITNDSSLAKIHEGKTTKSAGLPRFLMDLLAIKFIIDLVGHSMRPRIKCGV